MWIDIAQDHLSESRAEVLEWKLGETIDQLEMRELLGEGGMGRVFLVHHHGWKLDLAAKLPRPELYSNAARLADFVREAELWVSLPLHPHVTSCHFVTQVRGQTVICAEYVAGGSLYAWITEQLHTGTPDDVLARLLLVAHDTAAGLAHAHAHGLAHLDVKPHNILVTNGGRAKVTDFGLARALRDRGEDRGEDRALATVGGRTLAYCSPEQARGGLVGTSTDVWSWAVSLLHAIFGELMWASGTVAPDVLTEIVRGEGRLAIPAPLLDLLGACLQVDAASRPAACELVGAVAELFSTMFPDEKRPVLSNISPRMADTANNRAVSLYYLGRRDDAFEALSNALEEDPTHLEAFFNERWFGLDDGRESIMEGRDKWSKVTRAGRDAEVEHAEAIWASAHSGRVLQTAIDETEDQFHIVALSPSAEHIFTLSKRGARVWTIATGSSRRLTRWFERGVVWGGYRPDSTLVLLRRKTIEIRASPSWEVQREICLTTRLPSFDKAAFVGSTHLVLCGERSQVLTIDLDTGVVVSRTINKRFVSTNASSVIFASFGDQGVALIEAVSCVDQSVSWKRFTVLPEQDHLRWKKSEILCAGRVGPIIGLASGAPWGCDDGPIRNFPRLDSQLFTDTFGPRERTLFPNVAWTALQARCSKNGKHLWLVRGSLGVCAAVYDVETSRQLGLVEVSLKTLPPTKNKFPRVPPAIDISDDGHTLVFGAREGLHMARLGERVDVAPRLVRPKASIEIFERAAIVQETRDTVAKQLASGNVARALAIVRQESDPELNELIAPYTTLDQLRGLETRLATDLSGMLLASCSHAEKRERNQILPTVATPTLYDVEFGTVVEIDDAVWVGDDQLMLALHITTPQGPATKSFVGVVDRRGQHFTQICSIPRRLEDLLFKAILHPTWDLRHVVVSYDLRRRSRILSADTSGEWTEGKTFANETFVHVLEVPQMGLFQSGNTIHLRDLVSGRRSVFATLGKHETFVTALPGLAGFVVRDKRGQLHTRPHSKTLLFDAYLDEPPSEINVQFGDQDAKAWNGPRSRWVRYADCVLSIVDARSGNPTGTFELGLAASDGHPSARWSPCDRLLWVWGGNKVWCVNTMNNTTVHIPFDNPRSCVPLPNATGALVIANAAHLVPVTLGASRREHDVTSGNQGREFSDAYRATCRRIGRDPDPHELNRWATRGRARYGQ